MNKLSTFLGLFLGIVIVFTNTYDFENLKFISVFFDWQAALIVFGGVLAAVLINYPLNQLSCIPQGFRIAFMRESGAEQKTVETLLSLAGFAQREGVVALERKLFDYPNTFLYTALEKMLVANDTKSLEISLNNELVSMKQRHEKCPEVFYSMATYAPAFGMLGTVMGLIIMMSSQAGVNPLETFSLNQENDVMQQLLSGMGIALVTTFYGVLLANFIFLPIAGKLESLARERQHEAEIITLGVLSIYKRESPRRTKDELLAFVSHYVRGEVLAPRAR